MKAVGVVVAAVLTLAAEPAFGQAQVPCTSIGQGRYECSWYRPGDGITGGSIVTVGTTTVGYLHQGRNWIICQQQGGDVRNAEGNRNHWFGWTQADNGRWGWASALDAVGGDDYGGFGGGTPNCNGAHGSPPTYNGIWGSPPPPLPAPPNTPPGVPAPVDADRDGASPPADCDDTNSRVYPGAPEVANDGLDQDCNGADAAGRLSAVVAFRWRAGRTTRVESLRVTEAPAGATVSVTCAGRRKNCPRTRSFTTNARGSVSMTRMFRRPLRPKAVVTVTVTAPNMIGRVKRYTIRKNKAPRSRTLCLVPGVPAPSRC
ncbi:MAG TPA: putative metal-binding motif-containing protein [Solirubrobacter sp.]|nr:putative metal-binding motif-containing protein [Solirubrobacter sp.]